MSATKREAPRLQSQGSVTKSEMLTKIEAALGYVLLGKEMSLEQRVRLICERIEELAAVARLPVQAPPPQEPA